jgi:hypothetical protein
MTEKKALRVLFCMGINQNFFDAPREEQLEVWAAFSAMWNGIHDLPGVTVYGNMDDDQSMVGPSCWPTCRTSRRCTPPATCSAPPPWALAPTSCGATARWKRVPAVN